MSNPFKGPLTMNTNRKVFKQAATFFIAVDVALILGFVMAGVAGWLCGL